ncbi:MAG: phosphate signaling complex protein PhoU [Candidatus Latescibacter sp.]|nr:phosphate signaling complex protein PhoU [Candidatus Latescibacter sp.]
MIRLLQREIDKLKKHILELGAVVEERVRMAVKSVEESDAALARKVIMGDIEIDHMEVDLEEECLKILALYQPVAIDLRFIIAVLKINNDLERLGDLAVNIAERATCLDTREKNEIIEDLTIMADKTQRMLRNSLDALVNLDDALAREVCAADDEVDLIHANLFTKFEKAVHENPERIQYFTNLIGVSRNLERIADHTTNIAEDVIYMSVGEIVRHRGAEFRSAEKKPPACST